MRGPILLTHLLAALLAASAARAGELVAVGSGDGMDVLAAIGEAFHAAHPAITLAVPPSIGSGGAIAAVGGGSAVLGRVARPLSDKDRALGLVATPVFGVPTAIYANASAGITGLTAGQLAGIFSGAVTNWREVGGADLRIRVISREEGESALLVLRAVMPGWRDLVLTKRSKIESTTPEVFATVLATEGAIAFASYAKYPVEQGALVLRIDGQAPMEPGYPAVQILNIVHKDATLTPDGRAFLAFAVSPEARAVITGTGAALPPR